MISITQYVYIFLTVAIIMGITVYESRIGALEDENEKFVLENNNLRLKVVFADEQLNDCKEEIEAQNESLAFIEKLRKQAQEDLLKWKNQPKEVKYQTVYKVVKEKSNDCNETKSTIDSVRKLDLNSL